MAKLSSLRKTGKSVQVKSVNERREPLLYPRRRSRPGCTDASFCKMPAAERKGAASPLGRGGLAGGDAHASLGFDRRAVGGETDMVRQAKASSQRRTDT
uniref:Uncharacterized protein n=1 Tax=Oryza glumipatula TaxID=40148 RepID=A0A0D9Z2U5_9ORYZ